VHWVRGALEHLLRQRERAKGPNACVWARKLINGGPQAPAAPLRAENRENRSSETISRRCAGRHLREIAVFGPFRRSRRACPARGAPGDFGPWSGALWPRSPCCEPYPHPMCLPPLVFTEQLEVLPVARPARVGSNDAVERVIAHAEALQSQPHQVPLRAALSASVATTGAAGGPARGAVGDKGREGSEGRWGARGGSPAFLGTPAGAAQVRGPPCAPRPRSSRCRAGSCRLQGLQQVCSWSGLECCGGSQRRLRAGECPAGLLSQSPPRSPPRPPVEPCALPSPPRRHADCALMGPGGRQRYGAQEDGRG